MVEILSLPQEIAHEGFFFLQFVFSRGDSGLAEFVERDVLHNFPLLAVRANRVAEDEALFDAVIARGANRDAEPFSGLGGRSEIANGVYDGIGGAGGTAQAASFDDGRAALLHG